MQWCNLHIIFDSNSPNIGCCNFNSYFFIVWMRFGRCLFKWLIYICAIHFLPIFIIKLDQNVNVLESHWSDGLRHWRMVIQRNYESGELRIDSGGCLMHKHIQWNWWGKLIWSRWNPLKTVRCTRCTMFSKIPKLYMTRVYLINYTTW